MSKICSKCGNTMDDAAKFCPKCGSAYGDEPVCPKCGRKLKPNTSFCPNCGADQNSVRGKAGGGIIKKSLAALAAVISAAVGKIGKISAGKKSAEVAAGVAHVRKGSAALNASIHTAAGKIGKIGAKKAVKYGCLALAVALPAAAVATRGSAPQKYEWKKSYVQADGTLAAGTPGSGTLDGGTMYIYTVDELPGTVTDPSGKNSKAYMRLYRDKNGIFITLRKGKDDVFNTENTPLTVTATISYVQADPKAKRDFTQDFAGTMAVNDNIIHFVPESTAYLHAALEDENQRNRPFTLSFPDGSVYQITMPGDSDYKETVEKVRGSWYIPTYDDKFPPADLKVVNPDLIAFMKEFVPAVYQEIETRKKEGVAVTMVRDLLNIGINDELKKMIKQYEEMGDFLPIAVDAAYYGECKNHIDTEIMKLMFGQVGEVSDILDWLFN